MRGLSSHSLSCSTACNNLYSCFIQFNAQPIKFYFKHFIDLTKKKVFTPKLRNPDNSCKIEFSPLFCVKLMQNQFTSKHQSTYTMFSLERGLVKTIKRKLEMHCYFQSCCPQVVVNCIIAFKSVDDSGDLHRVPLQRAHIRIQWGFQNWTSRVLQDCSVIHLSCLAQVSFQLTHYMCSA